MKLFKLFGMSELATAHYAALAEANHLAAADIPGILNGIPLPLLDPEQEVPVRNPGAALVEKIEAGYMATIRSLGGFLVACTFPELDTVPAEPPLARGTTRHIGGIVDVLLKPHNRSTGYRTGLQIQAISPEETSENSLRTVLKMQGSDRTEEYKTAIARSVLLVMSTNIFPKPKSPREPDYIGFVGIVRAVPGPAISATGRKLGMLELTTGRDTWKPVS